MITRRRNQNSICLAVFCILMTGLIALASCASLASSIVFQKAGQSLATGCGSVTVTGPGGGGSIPTIAIAPTPPGIVYVGCDVGGVYKSTNDGESWVIKNKGLMNYDTRSIVIDPYNPSVVYVATTGGIFKSTDGGENWAAKRNGFPDIEKWSLSAPVSVLVIDPVDPDTIYAGIGCLGVSVTSYEESHGKGTIYKTLDGGESWFIVNTGASTIDSSAVIHSIAIDSSNTSTLYTATNKGLYKSTDGGVNWTAKNDGIPIYSGETSPNVRQVIVNPHNPITIYATVQTKPNTEPWQGGVYKSTDGGENWVAKCNGLAQFAGGPYAHPMQTSNYRHMVIDPENPETLYVGDYSWGDSGVYKTTDGGDNWVRLTIQSDPGQNMDHGWIDFCGVQVTSLNIDPSDPDRLYFGTSMTLFKTNDGGGSWFQVYTREREPGRWQSIGLETSGMWHITIDKTNPDNIYIGQIDTGFLKSIDGGTSFKRSEILNPWGGNTFSIAIDPDSPNIIYAGAGMYQHTQGIFSGTGQVVKSTDYGESWTIIGSPLSGLPDSMVHSIVVDPTSTVDSRTLYAACQYYGVYKSVDGGQSWVSINNGIGANRYVYSLVMDPNNPDILYLGIRATGQSLSDYGGVYKTTSGGESWTKANQNIELPDVYVLVIDPSDSNTLYAGTSQHYTQPLGPLSLGGVYKSVDGGENWQAMLTDNPPLGIFNIEALAISPVNPDLIFAGASDYAYHDVCTGDGIFISRDGGETWETMNEGLPMLIINALAAHPTNPDMLYAGTKANGLLRIVVPRPASLTDLTISPTEVDIGDTVTVSVLVTNSGDIECTYQVELVVDGSVEETSEVTLAGGESQTVTFTTAKNVAGVYSVAIGNLSGIFTVKPAPEPPVTEEEEQETTSLISTTTQPSASSTTTQTVTPTPTEPANWPVIGGIIGGVVVVMLLLIYLIVLRRRIS
jgi:photosystem II stability/assembly factor-like uncharacterized protein